MEYLKYKMKIKGISSETLATDIGISMTSYYKRMTEQVEWTCREMKTIKDMLQLSNEEFNKIFGF